MGVRIARIALTHPKKCLAEGPHRRTNVTNINELDYNTDMFESAIPTHVGFILDGNRRWAREHGLPIMEGHQRGYEVFKAISKACAKRGVKYISAYTFSTENWKRSQEEVDYLMNLILWVVKNEVDAFVKQNVRIRILGSREGLSDKVIKAIDRAEEKSRSNTGVTVALCINYGGCQEVADAVKQIINSGLDAGKVTPEAISERLYASDIPPADLIIRTSGERRISNFMLWRAAYSELYFADCHWPDFDDAELDQSLLEFAQRKRRFGR